jgi:hypothetical protein
MEMQYAATPTHGQMIIPGLAYNNRHRHATIEANSGYEAMLSINNAFPGAELTRSRIPE